MKSNTSLDRFFDQTDSATLNNCESEKIHLSGAIQNVGALLVVDPETEQILGASENATTVLGADIDRLLQSTVSDISPELGDQLRDATMEKQILHEALEFEIEHEGTSFDTVTHFHAGKRIIEFVPNLDCSPKQARTNMRRCSKSCAQIIHADHFDDALQITVDAVRQISGYARAKIYKFLPDWSGEVIAESTDGSLPSYLGLCFPQGDIPKQVREIMRIVPCRAISTSLDDVVPIRAAENTSGDLDLTWSVLRSVSTMHTQYLRNIGVEATFSCGLMHQDRLWGVIVIHHTESGLLSFDNWSLVQELGIALMLRYAQQQRTDSADMVSRLRQIESSFASGLRKSGDVEDVISSLVPVLREFLGADGFAFQFGNNLHLSGRTPPKEFIPELIRWATKRRETSDQFQSVALHREFERAKEHIDTCCGVLIQPIVVHRVCQLIWFRGPITRTVSWAGKPADKSGENILGPRNSFETWVQEHNDQSAPWREDQIETAREIFKEFLDIIASQMLLKEENESLRQFAATAAHDLKAPLLGLNTALNWMSEDNFDPKSLKETHAMAQRSSQRLADLTEGLLELAVLEEQTLQFEPVQISKLVDDIADLLTHQITQTGATIKLSDLPMIAGTERLLLRVFLNLISNAIKYRHPDRAPHIDIKGWEAPDGFVGIEVVDNGEGIAPKFAESVFQPLTRLHSKDAVEGTGLGLTICHRIVAAHGGTIHLDPKHTGGACFRIALPGYQTFAFSKRDSA